MVVPLTLQPFFKYLFVFPLLLCVLNLNSTFRLRRVVMSLPWLPATIVIFYFPLLVVYVGLIALGFAVVDKFFSELFPWLSLSLSRYICGKDCFDTGTVIILF